MPKFTLISHGQYNTEAMIFTQSEKSIVSYEIADFCIIFASKKICCSFWLDKIAV